MKYSVTLNPFLKESDIDSEEKISNLDSLSTDDLLTLMRNIEERPHSYEEAIIKTVIKTLMDRNIYCL